jgi:DNA-binding transcriptional LysR family regulator
MNLTQLSAFRAVMTSASLSDAARKLGRTQPAVSLAIRSLEDTLGMKLFERRGRQLVPVKRNTFWSRPSGCWTG